MQALGIIWLHEILKVVHRDLKPANLLLDENLRVKVTDFGFSELYEKSKGREVEMKGTGTHIFFLSLPHYRLPFMHFF